jgi:hypothetical protein
MAHAASPALRGRAGSLVPWKVPLGLWAAAALGLAIRLYVVLVARPTCEPYSATGEHCRTIAGDSLYFYLQGQRLAEGQWFVNPLIPANEPMAGDPPVFASFLALLGKLGIDSPQGQRVVTCVVGAVGVVLVGLLAGRLGGPRAAVIAGVLAATYPMLWINDGQLMSESLYIPLVAGLLLAAYQLYERPTVGRALALGALVSLAALTRGEAVLFFPLLVVPLVLGFRRLPLLRRAALCGVAGVAGALVLAPWFLFNLSRFEVTSTMSSSPGSVMLSSACDRAYSGDLVGYYSFECLVVPVSELDPVPADADKSVDDAALRATAQRYVSDNLGELPRVAAFRVGRIWELYRPLQNVNLNDISESRGRFASEAGLVMYVVLMPLAVAGVWVLHRRDLPVTPFLGLAVTASVVAALTFGVTRYRVPVDVGLVVLAALAIDAAWRRWSRGALPKEQPADDVEGAGTTEGAGAVEDELVGAST